jgi:3-oxoacyl-[acyl-carrier-protein] synthase II
LLALHSLLPAADFDPKSKLGQRGLRYKNEATKLALCAVQEGLLAAGLPLQVKSPADTGVIVSSNLGNVETVCHMVQTLRRHSATALSPMDVPNASSNVIATTIAIRFGCRAVNLMLCNGATSGLDALYTAANVIRAGRATCMIVVGVETRNAVVTQLMTQLMASSLGNKTGKQVVVAQAAACLVVEAMSSARARGARILGCLADYHYIGPECHKVAAIQQFLQKYQFLPQLWLAPGCSEHETESLIDSLLLDKRNDPPSVLDLNIGLGELYGALGVFQGAAACLWLTQKQKAHSSTRMLSALALSGGKWGDGLACMLIHAYPLSLIHI